ncbi:MAG: hypothetical protein C0407_02925, partial [Desulfobacca sp.]|nr:hypothetical protein [Desulfobacca sp.]
NRYYLKGLRHFTKAGGINRHFTGGVIYGGDEVQKRSGFPVYPVTQCEGLVAEQEGSQRFLFQKIE